MWISVFYLNRGQPDKCYSLIDYHSNFVLPTEVFMNIYWTEIEIPTLMFTLLYQILKVNLFVYVIGYFFDNLRK